MKRIFFSLSLIFLIQSSALANSTCCDKKISGFFRTRSLSVNLPRIAPDITNYFFDTYDDMPTPKQQTQGFRPYNKSTHPNHNSFSSDNVATFMMNVGYAQSTKPDQIAETLFGCKKIGISGRDVSNRNSNDWLADYFGLSDTFQGTVCFDPKINNTFVDFACHIGFDKWIPGVWFNAWTTFNHTYWNLDWRENITNNGLTGTLPIAYWSSFAMPISEANRGNPRSGMNCSAQDFFSDCKTPNLTNQDGTAVNFEPLKNCKWHKCNSSDLTHNGLADIRLALGYNLLHREDRHFGIGILGAIPTGNRPDSCYLFDPIVGNGKHGELGVSITSGVRWHSEDEQKNVALYFDANITHLFGTKQKRCFDLCGKPFSRYMLAAQLGTPVEGLVSSTTQNNAGLSLTTAPNAQFKNSYAPVANLTNADVNVSVGAQVDLAALISITYQNFVFNLGYNLWAQSKEKIDFDCDCPPRLASEKETWVLKGDSYMYGFQTLNNNDTIIALSPSQSKATINTGINKLIANEFPPNNFVGYRVTQNPGIDNPEWSIGTIGGTYTLGYQWWIDNMILEHQIRTSNNPIFLSTNNIDFSGSQAHRLTHSIFGSLNYEWNTEKMYRPYLGLGAQGEFAAESKSYYAYALSQWYVWASLGIRFN